MLIYKVNNRLSILFLILLVLQVYSVGAQEKHESFCHGQAASGSLENGWQLPSSGRNFEAYSSIGTMAGRNYVHSKIYAVVVDTYAQLEQIAPGKRFVYGETGFESGGKFRPHKTHQNGLSVDFFVPVIDSQGKSVPLPTSVINKLGYNIEFNPSAKYKDLSLDFETMAKHLKALKEAADQHGVSIRVVIFDNEFQKKLKATPTGKDLPKVLTFSIKEPWVRHDEHYHVDFIVQCN
jgi:penicillin-insensitive murein DD-endopeptidase